MIKNNMQKTRLIRLIKDRNCNITGVSLPKDTTIFANHVISNAWSITIGRDSKFVLGVIEDDDLVFVE